LPRRLGHAMFEVVDTEKRAIVKEFEAREEAEAFKAELFAQDPTAEGLLIVTSTGEPPATCPLCKSPLELMNANVQRGSSVTRERVWACSNASCSYVLH
jgi:hypothetical protein